MLIDKNRHCHATFQRIWYVALFSASEITAHKYFQAATHIVYMYVHVVLEVRLRGEMKMRLQVERGRNDFNEKFLGRLHREQT